MTDLDAHLRAAEESHILWYSPQSARYVPFALIDYVGLGLLYLARRRELRATVDSVYLPLEFL